MEQTAAGSQTDAPAPADQAVSGRIIHSKEANIRNGATQYQKTSEASISGRDTECAAFRMINRELAGAPCDKSRTRAIGRNHALWSILVKDLALAENRLPDGMKNHLMGLGLWAMRYSTLALLKDLSVEPLIEINRNVLDGLMEQASGSAAKLGPTSPFSA